MGKAGDKGSDTAYSVEFGKTFLTYYNDRYSRTTVDKIDDFIDHYEAHGLFGPPAWVGKIAPSYKVPDAYPNKEQIEAHARAYKLWHVHIGDPTFKPPYHQGAPYQVSDWVLHFQKLSPHRIKLLELGYHNPMALPSEALINEE